MEEDGGYWIAGDDGQENDEQRSSDNHIGHPSK